jgi:hypothetical protein
MSKMTQTEAGYMQEADMPEEVCRMCISFQGRECEIVEGPISPEGTCSHFEYDPSLG